MPQGLGPDPAGRRDADIHQGDILGSAVFVHAQDLAALADIGGRHQSACHQPGGKSGHGRLPDLGKGVVGAGGQGHQRHIAALLGHQTVGAVAPHYHDGPHAAVHHQLDGPQGIDRAVLDGHLQEMHFGQFLRIAVTAVLQAVHDVAGDSGHVRHHEDLADPQHPERAQQAVYHVAFLGILEDRRLGHQPPHVTAGRRVYQDADGRIVMFYGFHIRQ